ALRCQLRIAKVNPILLLSTCSTCFEIVEGDHAALHRQQRHRQGTLIDMIIHTDDYLYDGKIEKDEAARIGYIPQFVKHEAEEISAFDFLAKPFVELQEKSEAICCGDGDFRRYGRSLWPLSEDVLDEMDAIDAYNYDSNIRKDTIAEMMTHWKTLLSKKFPVESSAYYLSSGYAFETAASDHG
ncbi:MAG: hypothetical protein ACLU3F_00005, partial [Blautia wexlerae]